MGQFNKALVALIMAAVMIVQRIWHIDLGLDENTVTIIVAGLSPILVYLVPNFPGSSTSSTLRSPPVATGLAFLAALAVIGFLSGCAPAGGGAQPALPSPADPALAGHIDTAQRYVMAAETAADTCVALKLPLCDSPAEQKAIAAAKAVADEALVEAKKQANEGAGATLVQTTLRVAMNALLLFYSMR